MPLADYTGRELRYRALGNTDPAEAERLAALAQQAVDRQWDTYEEMATHGSARFAPDARNDGATRGDGAAHDGAARSAPEVQQ